MSSQATTDSYDDRTGISLAGSRTRRTSEAKRQDADEEEGRMGIGSTPSEPVPVRVCDCKWVYCEHKGFTVKNFPDADRPDWWDERKDVGYQCGCAWNDDRYVRLNPNVGAGPTVEARPPSTACLACLGLGLIRDRNLPRGTELSPELQELLAEKSGFHIETVARPEAVNQQERRERIAEYLAIMPPDPESGIAQALLVNPPAMPAKERRRQHNRARRRAEKRIALRLYSRGLTQAEVAQFDFTPGERTIRKAIREGEEKQMERLQDQLQRNHDELKQLLREQPERTAAALREILRNEEISEALDDFLADALKA